MGVILWVIAAVVFTLIARKVVPFLISPYVSPVRSLPGPPNPSWLYGQMKQIIAAENSVLQEEWVEKYGHSITYTGLFNINRLFTVDARALNHILTHSFDFRKPQEVRNFLTRLLGAGVLVTEGEQHRQQRRVLNPAFGPAQIRELAPIFSRKAMQLRDIWMEQVANGPKRIDALQWLSRATLDIIGLAGFNYDFNTLRQDGEPDEVSEAFRVMLQPNKRLQLLTIVVNMIPGLRYIFPAMDIPESQRLSDEDVLAQIPTFLFAGHETTSSSVTWCLFALTQAPGVQRKLRDELLSVSTDSPTMDELAGLPYLDMVVKETLRIHAPVPMTVRQAVSDTVIPVSEPYIDRSGVVRDEIRVAKGDIIWIPILLVNRLKKFWGDDSREFRPERWEDPPAEIAEIPGVWGHLMTFLGGPRACIGYRFSLLEMKAIIFALVRSFEFELAVSPEHVVKKSETTQRPLITTEPEKGNQMPLIIKLYKSEEA
ncbi:cytochrome P450 [Panus rudis PR-1116 ss-1]|nr:cytochrome P450 [Panus rudis PR-1116 ss-1]